MDPIRKKFEADVELQKLRDDAYPEGESKQMVLRMQFIIINILCVLMFFPLENVTSSEATTNKPSAAEVPLDQWISLDLILEWERFCQ